jgi:hypothetical protein
MGYCADAACDVGEDSHDHLIPRRIGSTSRWRTSSGFKNTFPLLLSSHP